MICRQKRAIVFSLLFVFCSYCLSIAQIDADRVLKIGTNALHYKDYVVAIEYFNQVISLRPEQADAYYFRALAKFFLGDYAGAEIDATQALERNPFITRAYMIRGVSRQSMNKNSLAVEDYRRALEINPDDSDLAFNLAGALFADKQYVAADTSVQQLLRRHPNHHRGWVLQSEIALSCGDTLRAEHLMQERLKVDSAFVEPYRILAMLAYQRAEYPQAISFFSQALKINPNELSDYVNRGLARYKNNDLRGALDDYNYAVELSPRDVVARYNRALLRHYVGDSQGALEDFSAVARKDPNNMVVRYNLALLKHELGLLREAIADYDVLLVHFPAFVTGYYQRSEAKALLGDKRGADKDYWYAYDIEHKRIVPRKADQTLATKSEQKMTDLELYNELLESNRDITVSIQSNVRGEIQNEDVSVQPLRAYMISYFANANENLLPKNNYNAELDAYNLRNRELSRLILTTDRVPIDSTKLRQILAEITLLTRDNQVVDSLLFTITQPDSLFRLGINYSLLRDYERAIECFTDCITLNDGFALAYLSRSYARFMSEAKGETERRSKEGASLLSSRTNSSLRWILDDLDRALDLSPNNGYVYYNKALVYEQLGEVQTAIENYTRAIEHLPNPADAYFNRGMLYLSIGKIQQGTEDLSIAGERGLYQAYNIIKRVHKTK